MSTSLSIASGVVSITSMSLTDSGISLFIYQVVASSYLLPADLEEAANAVTSKSGWFSSNWMNLCPTIPVAPSTPTFTISNTYSNPKTSFILLTIPFSAFGMYLIALITPAINTSLVCAWCLSSILSPSPTNITVWSPTMSPPRMA